MFTSGALAPLFWLFDALAFAAFVFEGWALVDAIRRPAAAFPAAGKQTKQIWLIILGVATVVGLGSIAFGLTVVSILPIAAFAAAAVYIVEVRPKVRDMKPGSHSGPYGPW